MPDDPEDRTAEFSLADFGDLKAARGGARKVPALTAIAGRALGRVFRLEQPMVLIGRSDEATVCIQDEGVSRRHARIELQNGRHVLSDLGSKNGTVVNDVVIDGTVVLQEGDAIRLGPKTILRYAARDELEEQLQARLYDLATRDPLTQAANRRAFDERLAAEWAWARRHDLPLAVCIVDADHFKQINDVHGHAAGDYVLTELVAVMRGLIRAEDMLARIGGEEFAILARATSQSQARVLAERVRAEVQRRPFVHEGKAIPVTVSIGLATSADAAFAAAADLLARADAALYRAKHGGRNRVAIAGA